MEHVRTRPRREPPSAHITAERLAYWYLRLNGFLTTTNFIVHPDQGRDQETDVDVLGVRFPFRAENLQRPMEDDARFRNRAEKILVRIAEVKAGACSLNGPWTRPERQNMLRLLCAVGAFPRREATVVAEALHHTGDYRNELYDVALLCLGGDLNEELQRTFPRVEQVLWPDALSFIFKRFRAYRRQKASHGQWDADGRQLWEAADRSSTLAQFVKAVSVR